MDCDWTEFALLVEWRETYNNVCMRIDSLKGMNLVWKTTLESLPRSKLTLNTLFYHWNVYFSRYPIILSFSPALFLVNSVFLLSFSRFLWRFYYHCSCMTSSERTNAYIYIRPNDTARQRHNPIEQDRIAGSTEQLGVDLDVVGYTLSCPAWRRQITIADALEYTTFLGSGIQFRSEQEANTKS